MQVLVSICCALLILRTFLHQQRQYFKFQSILEGSAGMHHFQPKHTLVQTTHDWYFSRVAPAWFLQDRTNTSTTKPTSLCHYLWYCFYPPLYIAGPIMTYQDFLQQTVPAKQYTQQKLPGKEVRTISHILQQFNMEKYVCIEARVRAAV